MYPQYDSVSAQLAAGTTPALLCGTCPWDRACIIPPALSADEVQAKIQEASQADKANAANQPGGGGAFPAATMLAILVDGTRSSTAPVCPVFALRLRSAGGRQVADSLRAAMQAWPDE